MTSAERPVALVTGGSRGIGRAVVLRLAEDGYDVGFCYHSNSDAAEDLMKEVARGGGRVFAAQADVADGQAVRELIAATERELGPIEVLVTSAGIVRDNPLLLMADEQWHEVLDVNLDGAYHACRAVVFEMMKRKSGRIVTISSIAGVYGNATQSNYSASKAGLIGFSRALAKEVGRYGIRVNAVAPGFIETEMTSRLTTAARDSAVTSVPLRRFGNPAEVAELVAFLASDRAAYITGGVFPIDGGLVI